MGQVIYLNKFDSAEELDKIMFSYRRSRYDTVMIDRRGLTVLLSMLVQGAVTITEHTYPYDSSIRDDEEIIMRWPLRPVGNSPRARRSRRYASTRSEK